MLLKNEFKSDKNAATVVANYIISNKDTLPLRRKIVACGKDAILASIEKNVVTAKTFHGDISRDAAGKVR